MGVIRSGFSDSTAAGRLDVRCTERRRVARPLTASVGFGFAACLPSDSDSDSDSLLLPSFPPRATNTPDGLSVAARRLARAPPADQEFRASSRLSSLSASGPLVALVPIVSWPYLLCNASAPSSSSIAVAMEQCLTEVDQDDRRRA
ncbi:hypothetical protein OCS_05756 [Ophiocordyceps sinensis CO18]|uniref:Uncharacterized protein n=1 Tax=Ophiocordyceps sinensis (strain Co18 / CGMCC 3.14243) TaxID=911162 RepID=T4ZZG2_OPHSC|nr:hypothetical protein OCS_05756 [Ophiocordyceps sinensis CO18]